MTFFGVAPPSGPTTFASASAAASTSAGDASAATVIARADLAVDLHRVLDRVGDQQRRDRRPGTPRRRATRRGRAAPTAPRRCAARAARPSAPAARRRRAGRSAAADDLRQVVVQLDQLGDRGVEPQVLHVGAHAVDRAVQQPRRLDRRPSPSASRSAPVSSSTRFRHSRCRKRYMPTMSRGLHGRDASSGPIDISYSRSVSAPYSRVDVVRARRRSSGSCPSCPNSRVTGLPS